MFFKHLHLIHRAGQILPMLKITVILTFRTWTIDPCTVDENSSQCALPSLQESWYMQWVRGITETGLCL